MVSSPAAPAGLLRVMAAGDWDPVSALGTGNAEPEPSSAAPPRRWAFFATTFLVDKLYSHGIAVQRAAAAGSDCSQDQFIVANGHDHTPQFAARVAVHPSSCTPTMKPAKWSGAARHFADVAAADLDGDGADEIVMASLADPTQRLDTGSVFFIDAAGTERPLVAGSDTEAGYAASSLAIGDLDEDGDLDILVGSFWAPKAMMTADRQLATREVEVAKTSTEDKCSVQKSKSDFPVWPPIFGFPVGSTPRGEVVSEPAPLLGSDLTGAVFVYLQTQPGVFQPGGWLDSPAAVDLHLEDIDGDGHLDLLTAGRAIRIIYGPLIGGNGPIEVQKLPWSGANREPLLAHSVDVAFVDVGGHNPQVIIAANEGCFNIAECGTLCAPGVALWSAARTGTRQEQWKQSFRYTPGLASALRFSSLDDGDKRPDLIVGRMSEADAQRCDCANRPQLGRACIGAPLLAFRGANDDTNAWLNRQADVIDIIDIGKPKGRDGVLLPMSFRILPYANGQTRNRIEADDRTHPAAGTAVTYTGAGHVVHVAGVMTTEGTPLAFRHIHGERHITLTAPYHGAVNVSWRIVSGPGFLVTSASPLRAPTGVSFFAQPAITNNAGGSNNGVE